MPKLLGSALTLNSICKNYGSLSAVRKVSLTIAPGEFVSFLGPSGSGKTTTLMMIAGFIPPDAGEIFLDKKDITQLLPHKRNFGMVYQNYALFPHMSVNANVAFPLQMRSFSRPEIARRVRTALELVQLESKGENYPRQLSGGQQQRVALARALVFEPPILLMDEPLGALDKKLRVEMQHEIKSIQNRLGITTVYVTHDQEEALSMSDRVVVMRNGMIEQAASPTELYHHPKTEFVAEFIGSANLFHAKVIAARPMRVRTSEGIEFASDFEDLPNGTPVTVVIRPERVRLSSDGSTSAVCSGHIDDVQFAGGLWRYRIRLSSGRVLHATHSNDGHSSIGQGALVTVDWSPADVGIIENPA